MAIAIPTMAPIPEIGWGWLQESSLSFQNNPCSQVGLFTSTFSSNRNSISTKPSSQRCKIQFVIFTIQFTINPLAILITSAKKSVSFSPIIPIIKFVAVGISKSRSGEFSCQFGNFVSSVCSDSNKGSFFQSAFQFWFWFGWAARAIKQNKYITYIIVLLYNSLNKYLNYQPHPRLENMAFHFLNSNDLPLDLLKPNRYIKLMPCPSMWPKQFWLVQNCFGLTKFIWTWP